MKRFINQQLVTATDIHCVKFAWNLIHRANELTPIEISLVTQEEKMGVMKAFSKMIKVGETEVLDVDKPWDMRCVETEERIEKTNRKYIRNAAFGVDDLVCAPEFIRVFEDGTLGLFVVHMSLDGETNEDGTKKGKKAIKWNEDLSKLSYQYYVLKKLGYHVSSAVIYYVNKQYEKGERHAWNEFFVQEEVIEHLIEHQFKTELAIQQVREIRDLKEEPECPGLDADRCINTPCQCFDKCKAEKRATDSIVWKLVRLYKTTKCSFVNNGIVTERDVFNAFQNGQISLNDKQYRQLMFAIRNEQDAFVNEDALKDWMKKTFEGKRRIVFFDFESYMYVVPKFKNLQPYTQLPFQWSAHVLDTLEMTVKHIEFLGQKGKDPREACARKMTELPIGESVVWIAYNMAFEKGVIGKLADYMVEQFADEECAAKLIAIYNSFADLMVPFQHHWIYKTAFQGSYSIKYVLPGLFPNAKALDYHNLCDIRNGVDAQRGYLQMQKLKGIELKELKQNMLNYCRLDTWAMVMVYGWLIKFIENGCVASETFSEDEIAGEFLIA